MDGDGRQRAVALLSLVLLVGLWIHFGASLSRTWAVQLNEAKGDKVHESDALLWKRDADTPRIASPIAHEGFLYALKSTQGMLSAFDVASGEEVYTSQRLKGVVDVYASPVVADERIYIAGRDGTVEVVATGVEFKSLAVNKLEDGFDASPAVAGDELYLRGREFLYEHYLGKHRGCTAATGVPAPKERGTEHSVRSSRWPYRFAVMALQNITSGPVRNGS